MGSTAHQARHRAGSYLTGSKDGSPHPSKRGFVDPHSLSEKSPVPSLDNLFRLFVSVGLKWDPLGLFPRPRTAKQQHSRFMQQQTY